MSPAEERVERTRAALEATVRKMRIDQAAFFKGDRTPARVSAAKRGEREVDRLLAELDALRSPPFPPAQGTLDGVS